MSIRIAVAASLGAAALAGCGGIARHASPVPTTPVARAAHAAVVRPNVANTRDVPSLVTAARLVRREVARGLLAGRDGATGPPTDAEVAKTVRTLSHPRCTRLEGHRFGCRTRIEGWGPYDCTVVIEHDRITDKRCGAGGAHPPVVTTGFTDCSTIGVPQGVSNGSSGRLTAVTMTRDTRALCLDFTLADIATARQRLLVLATRAAAGRPSESLDATIDLKAPGGPSVTTLNHGAISARVGREAHHISVLIAASALPPALRYLFQEPIQVTAYGG